MTRHQKHPKFCHLRWQTRRHLNIISTSGYRSAYVQYIHTYIHENVLYSKSDIASIASLCLFAVASCETPPKPTHLFQFLWLFSHSFPTQTGCLHVCGWSGTCSNDSNILNVFVWLTDSVTGSVRCQSCASLALRLLPSECQPQWQWRWQIASATSECGKWKNSVNTLSNW